MSWRKKGGPDEVIVILDVVDETDGSRGSVGRGGRVNSKAKLHDAGLSPLRPQACAILG